MAARFVRRWLTVALALAASRAGAGTLQVSPPLKDFGNVGVTAGAANGTVTITNTGTNTTISGLTKGAGCTEFSVSSALTLPVVLGNGQQLTVNVSYDPSDRAADACNVTITDSNAVTDVIQLQGDGIAPDLFVAANTMTFADQPWNSSTHETQQLTVDNMGDMAFDASNLGLVLTTGTQFSIGSAIGTFPVNPGESIVVPVTFDPTSVGAKTDMLTVSLDNDAPGGNRTVSLSGTGTDALGVGDEGPARSGVITLRPMPSRGSLTIDYSAPRTGPVLLEVMDLSGRVVARRRAEASAPGRGTFFCRDGQDWSPATGLYLVKISQAGRTLGTARATVIR